MNEELNLEKLADLAVHYPEYLIDAAAEHFNGDECKLEAIAVVVSGLNELYMPSTALLFLRVLSGCSDGRAVSLRVVHSGVLILAASVCR